MSQRLTGMERFVTNPMHGGKVTCHKCGGFIEEGDELTFPEGNALHGHWWHEHCYNTYEHYYGLDKPID